MPREEIRKSEELDYAIIFASGKKRKDDSADVQELTERLIEGKGWISEK